MKKGEIVHQQTTQKEKIPFIEFMDRALYHPTSGYYTRGGGIGHDFSTSPHIHPGFGKALAWQILEIWERMSLPAPFTIVEFGAGEGILADDILSTLQNDHRELLRKEKLRYLLVERSPSLIKKQKKRLRGFSSLVQWRGRSQSYFSFPPVEAGCVISNEFLDALPCHRVRWRKGKWEEIYVIVEGVDARPEAREVEGRLSTPRLAAFLRNLSHQYNFREGYTTEVNLSALQWVREVAASLKRGAVITIDYGYPEWEYYHPSRIRGTFRCFSGRMMSEEPYLGIGKQDMTASVNFTALAREGKRCGLKLLGFTTQSHFLLGLDLLSLAKGIGKGKDPGLHELKENIALSSLLNPHGFGEAYKVLIQAREGRSLSTPPLKGLSLRKFPVL